MVGSFCPSEHPQLSGMQATIYASVITKVTEKDVLTSKSETIKRPKVVTTDVYNCVNMM